MLFQVAAENFYSIRDRQVIDLRVPANAPDLPERFAPAWKGAADRVPKVIAIFGPNASGKSTVLRAISFIAWFVRESFNVPSNGLLPYQRFNDGEAQAAPTFLSVSLAGMVDPEDQREDPPQCRYVYELELGGPAGTPQHVLSETMYYWPSGGGRKTRLFRRDRHGKVTAATAFGLAGYRTVLDKILRSNASVISTLAQLNHPFATALREAANDVVTNILIDRVDPSEDQVVRAYAANPTLVDALNREIERIDLGVRGVRLETGPSGPIALFTHQGHDRPMHLDLESHGTRSFFRLYPLLLLALERGGVAVIDELDAAIHPLILPELLRWFHDPVRNPHNAQLWLTCQSASLLEELVKEEVLFCAKSGDGRTEVYGLADIQAVRRDDNYYRKYLSGAYGAIPRIG